MVARSGICNGIIAGRNAVTPLENQKLIHTILGFLVDGGCYLIIAIRFLARNVEKFTKLDNQTIVNNQKELCLKEGKEWITPEERAKKDELASKKKEAADRKKKQTEEKKKQKFDSLPQEKKDKILAKKAREEKRTEEEFSALVLKAKNSGLSA